MPGTLLVTGAASTIGRAIVQRIGEDAEWSGSRLLLSTTDPSKIVGPSFRADLSRPGDVDALIAEARSKAPLQGALLVAGVNMDQGISGLSEGTWDRVWDIDFKAHMRLSLALAGSGVFVSQAPVLIIGSIVGSAGNAGQAAYAAAKGALLDLCSALCRRGLRCNVLLPPLVESPLLAHLSPEARELLFAKRMLADPEAALSAAEAAVFLLSKRSSYVNHVTWHADSRVSLPDFE